MTHVILNHEEKSQLKAGPARDSIHSIIYEEINPITEIQLYCYFIYVMGEVNSIFPHYIVSS